MPSVSGDYTFDIASDDQSQFWLSSNEDPANANTWVVLDSMTDQPKWHDRNDWKFWGLANTTAYQYYRLDVTTQGDAIFQISEIGLFESVGGAMAPEIMAVKEAGNVILSWPDSAGYLLYQTPVLGTGASWTEVGAGTLEGTTRSVTVTPSEPMRFYQLKK